VAKAGGKHTSPQTTNARISPEEALRKLNILPIKAASALTRAIHENDCRIYCNGSPVAAHMLPDIRIVAVLESDGRWTAAATSISNQWPGHIFHWELDQADVEKLRKVGASASTRSSATGELAKNRGGSPDKWNWLDLAARLPGIVKEKPFEDLSALEEWCTNNARRIDGKPRDEGPDRRTVRAAIERHRFNQIPRLFKQQ
jgi:hypothetical protein